MQAETFAEWRHSLQTMTASVARLAGQVINETLEFGTFALDANGLFVRQWKVAAGAVRVTNTSAAGKMWVFARDQSAGAPAAPTGIGVYVVPPGQTVTVPLASRVMTIAGTPADVVSFAAYVTGSAPNGATAVSAG